MCLLCEEMWMSSELWPEAKSRTFVADSPAPENAPDGSAQTASPLSPTSSSSDEDPAAAG